MNCNHCGYEWITKKDNPKACPRCKYRFDSMPTRIYPKACSNCGYNWLGQKLASSMCPRCHKPNAVAVISEVKA